MTAGTRCEPRKSADLLGSGALHNRECVYALVSSSMKRKHKLLQAYTLSHVAARSQDWSTQTSFDFTFLASCQRRSTRTNTGLLTHYVLRVGEISSDDSSSMNMRPVRLAGIMSPQGFPLIALRQRAFSSRRHTCLRSSGNHLKLNTWSSKSKYDLQRRNELIERIMTSNVDMAWGSPGAADIDFRSICPSHEIWQTSDLNRRRHY